LRSFADFLIGIRGETRMKLRRTPLYGIVLVLSNAGDSIDDGITTVEAEDNALTCVKSGSWSFPADPSFSVLKRLEKETA
jgi:hypothetical protein